MQRLSPGDRETASLNLITESVTRLRELFPELVTEGPGGVSVNVDVLRQLVGDRTITDAEEKYGLNWHGKRRARQLALTPSAGTLRPCPMESVDWNTTRNIMIEGDNLEVLKLLQKSYAGKVKLIYIDPPYNTGKDFVYPDNFQHNIHNYLELTGQIEGDRRISTNTERSGRFHTDWLNMMYPRLKLARNLLREDGVIFITIDDHEVAGLCYLCDEIFGEENRQGILVWQHSLQPKGYSGTFSVHHNFILCYQKGEDFKLANLERTDENNRNYSNPDNDPKGAWRPGDVRNALYRPNLIYPIITPSGKSIAPPANGWRWSKATMASKILSGEIVFSSDETRITRKIYLNTLEGRTPETILFGKEAGTTRDAANEVKELFDGSAPFDTPKPTALIQHLLSLSGASGDDIVFDFFAGSGTCAQAVWQYNALKETRLRVILTQLPEPVDPDNTEQKAAAAVCDKLRKPRTIAELTKERIRRAGTRIGGGDPHFAGDLGFRVFKLDTSNIQAWEPDRQNLADTLEASIEHLKPNRTEPDILFEVLLKLGLDLCVPIETTTVAGAAGQKHEIHSIGGGTLMACLSPIISQVDVEAVALSFVEWHKQLKPAGDTTVVFRDSAFPDDVAKTNLTAILQQHGLESVRSL